MEKKRNLTGSEKAAYGLGAVGKDMVYMLSSGYILFYYQDTLHINPIAMGIILLAARIFDAFNDPIMGVIVAKTKTRWGKFRPWLMIGTLTNSVVLYLMFACPPDLKNGGLIAYAAVFYVLWGVTYTMMDIPFWSMIPAFTREGKEREGLSAFARSCAGVGSALVSILAMKLVYALGGALGGTTDKEIVVLGFKWFALIVAILFVIFIVITCMSIKENSTADMETASVRDMFKALVRNDQAMAVVITIVLVNIALYITSNLLLYFFKYDFGGSNWYDSYTLFNTVAGAAQILAMMVLYPLLRKFMTSIRIFYCSLIMSIIGYVILLFFSSYGLMAIYLLLIPGVMIMAATGMNNVLVTIFLANTCDYGEYKNGRRDESVIFSMQTFVVKLASGIAAFLASVALSFFNMSSEAVKEADKKVDFSKLVSGSSKIGLRMVMTILPIIGLIIAFFWFKKRYILTDEKNKEITEDLKNRQLGVK
jgi:melibiose permease